MHLTFLDKMVPRWERNIIKDILPYFIHCIFQIENSSLRENFLQARLTLHRENEKKTWVFSQCLVYFFIQFSCVKKGVRIWEVKLYQQVRKLKVEEDISLDNIFKKEEKQVVSHRRKHLGHGFRGEGFFILFHLLVSC